MNCADDIHRVSRTCGKRELSDGLHLAEIETSQFRRFKESVIADIFYPAAAGETYLDQVRTFRKGVSVEIFHRGRKGYRFSSVTVESVFADRFRAGRKSYVAVQFAECVFSDAAERGGERYVELSVGERILAHALQSAVFRKGKARQVVRLALIEEDARVVECVIADRFHRSGDFVRRARTAERIIIEYFARGVRQNAVCRRERRAAVFHRERFHVDERPERLFSYGSYRGGQSEFFKFPAIGERHFAQTPFAAAELHRFQFAQIVTAIIADHGIRGGKYCFFDCAAHGEQSAFQPVCGARYQFSAISRGEIKFGYAFSEVAVHQRKDIALFGFGKAQSRGIVRRYLIGSGYRAVARNFVQRLGPAAEFGNGRNRRFGFFGILPLAHLLLREHFAVPVGKLHNIFGNFPHRRERNVLIADGIIGICIKGL